MLISEIVDQITSMQEIGMKVMTFIVPVAPGALENCGLSAATVEDRVKQAMIAELNECLAQPHDEVELAKNIIERDGKEYTFRLVRSGSETRIMIDDECIWSVVGDD